ncbi:assimilatory sulfite reductase (NADPH) flavoprotein subunit [Emcibacter sp.]|uniref:assimilatory sulfite reductase (NADPH) flavoprotein subunit n=1 Tax=Emcibacter sp. TaxID=1979954 RepID=UPI003A8E560A
MTKVIQSPLSNDQKKLVEALSSSIGMEEARWISAYFEGFRAALQSSDNGGRGKKPAARSLTILYGSETGNAVAIAEQLRNRAVECGLEPHLKDMADYKFRQLDKEEDLLIVVSTYGEGDPPQPAVGFFEFVEGRKAPRLDHLRYAVLGLGDSSYEFFCEAGKRLDQRFETLGAKRLSPRVDCDIDYEKPAEEWSVSVLETLGTGEAPGAEDSRKMESVLFPASPVTDFDKKNPFIATVIENLRLTGAGSTKETRHIEISIEGSGLVYEPGDALGIWPSNDPEVVAALLDSLGMAGDFEVELNGKTITLEAAFADKLEITTATPRFLTPWAERNGLDIAEVLQKEGNGCDTAAFLGRHHIVDIVRKFPCDTISPQDFIGILRPLQPRLYSIASSMAAVPGEAHLTVSAVRYRLGGEERTGVASGMLADRIEMDSELPVYIQKNRHFRLPVDKAPIILIGAGTGIAPYRAFMQQREADGEGGESWLFFGERNFRTDFLYQTEWQGWLKDGTLGRMDVAFSRDGVEKIYVQHRIRERSRELFEWLEKGAHIYVCGDAENMARGVHQALLEVIAAETKANETIAEEYLRRLTADHRYHKDVY